MTLLEPLVAARSYLSRFDYDNYPLCFQEFETRCRPAFDALGETDLEAEAAALLQNLEAARAALPRREQKAALEQDKQVLALFLSPAARRHGDLALAFAEELRAQWLARYPRAPYYIGDFDTIMKGFDANLLGLPLRKSKKRS